MTLNNTKRSTLQRQRQQSQSQPQQLFLQYLSLLLFHRRYQTTLLVILLSILTLYEIQFVIRTTTKQQQQQQQQSDSSSFSLPHEEWLWYTKHDTTVTNNKEIVEQTQNQTRIQSLQDDDMSPNNNKTIFSVSARTTATTTKSLSVSSSLQSSPPSKPQPPPQLPPPPPQQQQKHYTFTILIDCMGEMGNWMHHIAYGYGLQKLVQELLIEQQSQQQQQLQRIPKTTIASSNNNNIHTHLIFRKRPGSKGGKGKKALQYLIHCFPNIQQLFLPQIEQDYYYTTPLTTPTAANSTSTNNHHHHHRISIAVGQKESMALEHLLNRQEEWLQSMNNYEKYQQQLTIKHPISLEETKNLLQYIVQELLLGVFPPSASSASTSSSSFPNNQTILPSLSSSLPLPSLPQQEQIYSISTQTSLDISFPILHIKRLEHFPLIDYYFNDYQTLFQLNETRCCSRPSSRPTSSSPPFPKESVYHFRNFAGELNNKVSYGRGHEELNPNRTANELFGHLPTGSSIAMTTRFPTHPTTQEYVHALTTKGLHVRVMTSTSTSTSNSTTTTTATATTTKKKKKRSTTTDTFSDPSDSIRTEASEVVQDFCFLTRTQYELIGNHASTFFIWAGLLSNATRVRIYGVQHLQRYPQMIYSVYNWTHPKLSSKLQYEFFPEAATTPN